LAQPDSSPQTWMQVLEGAQVLLVEDNPLNQLVAREFLNSLGVQVECAENGLLAVEMVQKKAFDLVLMDLHMPIMDGFAATSKIRQLLGKDLPIIAMTADAATSDRERCLAAGMDDHIGKPFDVYVLPKILARWCKKTAKSEVDSTLTLKNTAPIIDIKTDSTTDSTTVKSVPSLPPASDVSPAVVAILPSQQSNAPVVESVPVVAIDPLKILEDHGFDVQATRARLGNKDTLFFKALTFYREELASSRQNLPHLYTEQETDKLRRTVHTLKGQSGNLGDIRVHEKSKALDIQLKQGEAGEDTSVLFGELLAEIDQSLLVLDRSQFIRPAVKTVKK
jgi:CheY-like chemotaxis protein/HPt (histidine-containing phosphotransfer) domain-containing protein